MYHAEIYICDPLFSRSHQSREIKGMRTIQVFIVTRHHYRILLSLSVPSDHLPKRYIKICTYFFNSEEAGLPPGGKAPYTCITCISINYSPIKPTQKLTA